jgi:Flp pilus assembly protein protease CpaA
MHQGVLFLVCLGIIWMFFATIQDFKKREVANWLSFSLILFAIGARFFYSLFSGQGFAFFYYGLIGLAIFFLLGNLFYYMRVFAGGDAKMMIALGAVIPFSENFLINLKIFFLFICLFFIIGAIYGLFFSLVLALKNMHIFKKEFSKQFKANRSLVFISFILGLFIFVVGFFWTVFYSFGLLIIAFPFLYLYAKAIEEGIMIVNLDSSKLSEGDWLYRDLKVGKETIEARWEGLNKKEIKKIQRALKKVKIKQGIPFLPVFLISFILLFWFYTYFPFEAYGILFGSHIFPLGLLIFSIF